MHDDEEHDELEEPGREELEEREARFRTDSFARALGESWRTEGDGIYRYMPETTSLKVPGPPPTEDRPASDVREDLENALAPGRRKGRGDADEPPSGERADADREASRERKRSLWKRW